ncbi:hypothetical protein AcW1_004967 [Taiwanofungus camphoratus]|nr:hypothetical protein AcW2_006025 [Antrodia cinnamomea]KAI0960461.1 hypothetical protein AcW1_004967 [Antrodia cinnamomea]
MSAPFPGLLLAWRLTPAFPTSHLELARVFSGNLLEVMKGMMLSKQAELDFVAGEVKESGIWTEYLAKYMVREGI